MSEKGRRIKVKSNLRTWKNLKAYSQHVDRTREEFELYIKKGEE